MLSIFSVGSENHYNFFESLISGRNLETDFQSVGERFKRIFPAQVLKGNYLTLAYLEKKNLKEEIQKLMLNVLPGVLNSSVFGNLKSKNDKNNFIKINFTS